MTVKSEVMIITIIAITVITIIPTIVIIIMTIEIIIMIIKGRMESFFDWRTRIIGNEKILE